MLTTGVIDLRAQSNWAYNLMGRWPIFEHTQTALFEEKQIIVRHKLPHFKRSKFRVAQVPNLFIPKRLSRQYVCLKDPIFYLCRFLGLYNWRANRFKLPGLTFVVKMNKVSKSVSLLSWSVYLREKYHCVDICSKPYWKLQALLKNLVVCRIIFWMCYSLNFQNTPSGMEKFYFDKEIKAHI